LCKSSTEVLLGSGSTYVGWREVSFVRRARSVGCQHPVMPMPAGSQ
jgi:hypothetical protein